MNRKALIALLVLVALVAGAFVLYRQMGGGKPETVALLPEGDLLVYANIKPLHFVNLNKSDPDDPEYQDFVRQTGIEWGRDLDNVAVSQRNPGANSESSAIFTGQFDSARLTNYLKKLSTGTERYADKVIYSIPHEGRTVRVTILSPTTVAVTNVGPADQIHSIIDKFRNSSLAGRGPYLFETHYRDVPFGSLAWAIYRVPAQSSNSQLLGGWGLDFLDNATTVASLRYSGSIHFKGQIFTESEASAQDLVERANGFLALYKSVGKSFGTKGTDPDVKAMINSIKVEESGKSALITATIPEGFIQKVSQGNISAGK
ncbi:MAG: hypothetical protein DMG65_03605 [Candidatus Angelobacter sp. Gp1-AA117]|nr:MAG: hypothetical protein DMG65_03605 [Candidatus Angelobacter sp. Gp1-AA117]